MFAAGNGGIIVKDSCAFNGYVNNIYTITITGINRDGSIPAYGERCAGIMAVTYSRDVFGDSSPVVGSERSDNRYDINTIVIPPNSNTFSYWIRTCHAQWVKAHYSNFLGRTKLTNTLRKQQLELSTRT